MSLTEIQRGIRHGLDLAGGNQGVISGSVVVGIEGQLMAKDGSAAGAAEVEVGVVGEVHRGGLVRGGLVIDAQFVLISKSVGHLHAEIAGVPFLAIRTGKAEGHGLRVGGGFSFPNLLAQRLVATAVQMVGIIVSRQCVLFTIERKLALGDAVADAACGAAKVLVAVALVAGHVVKTVNHVHQIAVLIR